jgi:hypothetical protein
MLSEMRDRGRDMYARYGLALYGVRILWVASVGGRRRGDGVDDVLRSWEILPVPKVLDLQSLTQIVTPAQIRESGTVVVSGISGSYSEDMLMGRGTDGQPPASGEAVQWELVFADPFGRVSGRRRMVTHSAPTYDGSRAEWSIILTRAYQGRSRQDVPRDGDG